VPTPPSSSAIGGIRPRLVMRGKRASPTPGSPQKTIPNRPIAGFSKPSHLCEAGVDIDAGNRMVELIKPLVRATARPGADAEIGGFGGLFDLKRAGFKDPVLVAGQ
jgi:hypothetical protein